MANVSIICDICGTEFTSNRYNYKKHLKLKHRIIVPSERSKTMKCLEPGCGFVCAFLKGLRKHLEIKHQIDQHEEELLFRDMEEFNQWKTAEESRCVAKWSKSNINSRNNESIIYYYCNRSGKSRRQIADNQRVRKFKSQGSCKIEFFCTSVLILKTVPAGIRVTYYKNHYGHQNEVCHVPLPDDVKEMIAAQLKAGISATTIRKNVKASSFRDIEKVRVLSRLDIHNVAKEYNLCQSKTGKPRSCKKLEQGSAANKMDTNHKKAAENSQNMIVIKFDDGWKLYIEDLMYSVKKIDLKESHFCKYTCDACASCVHAYSCSCADYMLRQYMCKHIHKVASSENKSEQKQESNYEIEQDGMCWDVDKVKDEIRKNMNSVLVMCDWTDVADERVLDTVNGHLKEVLNLIGARESGARRVEVKLEVCSADEDSGPMTPLGITSSIELKIETDEDEITAPVKVEETSHVKRKPRKVLGRPRRKVNKNIASKSSDIVLDTNSIMQKYRPIIPSINAPSRSPVEADKRILSSSSVQEANAILLQFRPIVAGTAPGTSIQEAESSTTPRQFQNIMAEVLQNQLRIAPAKLVISTPPSKKVQIEQLNNVPVDPSKPLGGPVNGVKPPEKDREPPKGPHAQSPFMPVKVINHLLPRSGVPVLTILPSPSGKK